MAVVGVLEIQMMADMARLSNDLKRANGEITSAVRGFNNILNTLGVGISFAFFADLARRSNEFEKSLAKISTQIDDTSGQIDKLANSAKNFASQFGTSQVEQTNAYYEIISAGIEDTAKATEILNTANKLAIGGMTSLGVSVDGLTSIMNSYAGKVESADAVSDALFVGMKAGKATMEELSSGLGKVTPLAATLNVSFDELVAVIATLSKQGIQTSESITGVRAILSAVAKPASEAAKLAGELGLEFNAASLQAKGFAGFIQDVISKTDGSTTALSTLFGRVEALVPVLSLAGTGGQDFNNILGQMSGKAGATQEAFEKMAASPGFKVDQLMAAISNAAITLGAKLSDVLTPAIIKVTQAFNNFFLTQEQSPLEKQISLISELEKKLASELDKKNIPFGDIFLFDKRNADLLAQRLEDAREDLIKLQQAQESTAASSGELKNEIEELTGTGGSGNTGIAGFGTGVDKTKQKIDSFVESIRKQAAEAGKTANEIKRMEAAQLGVLHVVEPYLTVIEKQAIAEEDLRVSRQKQADDLRKIEQLTQSVRTKQEVYNDTVKELDDLLSKGLGMEAYNRALKNAQEQLAKTEKESIDRSRNFWDTNEQIWIQGVRNVQSSLANGLFNIFDDGLKGMVNGVKRAVGQMLAEFASIKILQSTGIAGLLELGSTAAFASGGASAGGGLSALNLASLGSGALNLVQGGFGLTGALGGGLSGDALGGLINGGFSKSAASAASIGSFINQNASLTAGGIAFAASSAAGNSDITKGVATALATFGGPYGAIAAAVVIGLDILNKNFGNHQITGSLKPISRATQVAVNPFFGAEYGINQFEKVLGTNIVSKALPGYFVEEILGLKSPDTLIANALFGRGVPKFKTESLVGNVTASGFDGVLNQEFREKGSVFKSNRTSNFIVDTRSGELLNEFGRLSESGNIPGALRDAVGEQSIQRALAMGEFLNDIFGDITKSINATADKFGLSKEALNNVNVELDLISEKGKELTQAQISEQVSAVTDAMIIGLIPAIDDLSKKGETVQGAFSRLNAQFSVLESAAMLFGNTAEQAAEKVRALGLDGQSAFIDSLGGVDVAAAEISEFYNNVFTDAQKLEVTKNQILGVLRPLGVDFIPTLDQLYDAVASGNPQLIQAALKIDGLVVEFNRLNESVTGIDLSGIDKIADSENLIATRRQTLIDVYRRESDALKTTIDRFRSLGAVLTDASDSLALSELSPLTPQQRLDEARRQFNVDRSAASIGDIDALNRLPESGRAFLQASQIFNASSAEFVSDFNFVKSVLDSAAKVADTEADIAVKQLVELDRTVSELVEINAGVKSLDDAIFELKDAIIAAVGVGVSGSNIAGTLGVSESNISNATGGLSVSGDQIRQFVQANINDPFKIYDAAKDFGISLSRVAKETGIPIKDIEEWTRANNLPMFESGTNFVQKGGLAVLHRAEAVTPASHMADMAREISELRKELSELRREQNQQTGALINVAMQSQRENAQTIVAANKELAKNDGWRKQVGGGLR